MRKRLFAAAVITVSLFSPLYVRAAGEPEELPEEQAVSEDAVVGEDTIEIPGVGVITRQDIEELAGITRDATDEYLAQSSDRPLKIVREPEVQMAYHTGYESYRYTLPDGQWIECNVPQGAFCRGSVEFNTSEGMTAVVHYRDGVAASGRGPFIESGSYVVTFWDLNVDGDANSAYRMDYCFTIYSDFRMDLSHIEAPAGMDVVGVTLDGLPQEVEQSRYVQARKDGTYHITFASGDVSYEMEYIRDTTPPVIEFTPAYRLDQVINSEVEFRVPEEGAELAIYRNYARVDVPAGRIPVNGKYRFVITDTVGNMREYRFMVHTPVKIFSKKMLLIPLALFLAAVLAALYWRRNMKVL